MNRKFKGWLWVRVLKGEDRRSEERGEAQKNGRNLEAKQKI